MIISEIFNLLPRFRFNASPPVVTDGQLCEAQCDANGKLIVTGAVAATLAPLVPTGITRSAGCVNSLVVHGAPASLLELYGFNDDTVTKYLMLFQSATLPGNGATPLEVIRAPEGSFAFSPDAAIAFTSGITVAVSTSRDTLTVDTASKTRITGVWL